MPGTLSFADWTVNWSIPTGWGGGLVISKARFRNDMVLYQGTMPFVLVPYHGGSPIFKDGLHHQGAAFLPVVPTAANAFQGPSTPPAGNDNQWDCLTNPTGAVMVERNRPPRSSGPSSSASTTSTCTAGSSAPTAPSKRVSAWAGCCSPRSRSDPTTCTTSTSAWTSTSPAPPTTPYSSSATPTTTWAATRGRPSPPKVAALPTTPWRPSGGSSTARRSPTGSCARMRSSLAPTWLPTRCLPQATCGSSPTTRRRTATPSGSTTACSTPPTSTGPARS